MKKSFKLNSNLLHSVKNFWFALQLLIVSVSLPVMSFMQASGPGMAHSAKVEKTKAASSQSKEMVNSQKQEKTVRLNS